MSSTDSSHPTLTASHWAPDLTAKMGQEKRAKLRNALRGSALYAMLDNTPSAAISYHTIMIRALSQGQHFDASHATKRGYALAGAWRSASVPGPDGLRTQSHRILFE
jgi:hypothetical protein